MRISCAYVIACCQVQLILACRKQLLFPIQFYVVNFYCALVSNLLMSSHLERNLGIEYTLVNKTQSVCLTYSGSYWVNSPKRYMVYPFVKQKHIGNLLICGDQAEVKETTGHTAESTNPNQIESHNDASSNQFERGIKRKPRLEKRIFTSP